MNKENKHSDWNKPLTKADFRLYQLQKDIGILAMACWIVLVIGVVMVIKAVYNFLSGIEYYGIYNLFYSLLCFLVGHSFYKKHGKLRDEQKQLHKKVLESDE